MGFNKRKLADQIKGVADNKARPRRALPEQVRADAAELVGRWNERLVRGMPMLFSPMIGAALIAGKPYLWVRCPGCRATQAIDLRTLDRHRDTMLTSLIPALSCRSCRPHAQFAALVGVSAESMADALDLARNRSRAEGA